MSGRATTRLRKLLARPGAIAHPRSQMATFRYVNEIAGLPEIQALENRYGVPEEQRTRL